ncbi:unnamed protein product, partial [Allacma fusca]
ILKVAMEDYYVVVEFIETAEISLVPSNWIKEERGKLSCYWPNFKKQVKIDAAIKDRVPAIESEWNLYEIRELEAFICYKTGMESLPHFENFSELSSSEASIKKQGVFKTRSGRIIAKKRLNYDGESSDGDAADQTKKFCLGPNNPPEFPNADSFDSTSIFTSKKTTSMQTREGIATPGTSGSMSVPKVYFTSRDFDEVDTSANFQAKFKGHINHIELFIAIKFTANQTKYS